MAKFDPAGKVYFRAEATATKHAARVLCTDLQGGVRGIGLWPVVFAWTDGEGIERIEYAQADGFAGDNCGRLFNCQPGQG